MNKTQTARFEKWYRVFPNRISRGDGEKAFESLDPDDDLTQKMILAVQAQIRYRAECKKTGEFTPRWKGPGPWVRQLCWKDEIGSHAELKEKAEARICVVEGCGEAVHAPKSSGQWCYYHTSHDASNRLRSTCLLVPEIRQHYQDHPELHDLRGESALKFCRAKIRGLLS